MPEVEAEILSVSWSQCPMSHDACPVNSGLISHAAYFNAGSFTYDTA